MTCADEMDLAFVVPDTKSVFRPDLAEQSLQRLQIGLSNPATSSSTETNSASFLNDPSSNNCSCATTGNKLSGSTLNASSSIIISAPISTTRTKTATSSQQLSSTSRSTAGTSERLDTSTETLAISRSNIHHSSNQTSHLGGGGRSYSSSGSSRSSSRLGGRRGGASLSRRNRQSSFSSTVSAASSSTTAVTTTSEYSTGFESGPESDSSSIAEAVTCDMSTSPETRDKSPVSSSTTHASPTSPSTSSQQSGRSTTSTTSATSPIPTYVLPTFTSPPLLSTKRLSVVTATASSAPPIPSPLGNEIASTSTTHAISIPSANPSISATLTPGPPNVTPSSASVRLSTTPLFPSPLAQASGPEEDGDPSKGEDGSGDSDEDAAEEEAGIGDYGSGNGRRGLKETSPLGRESFAPFGDLDISPTLNTVGLPDVNALGLEASNLSPSSTATPRAGASKFSAPPASSTHRRSPSARESSPDIDFNRSVWTPRVRSVGRASGLVVGAAMSNTASSGSSSGSSQTSPTDEFATRRRSRLFDTSTLSSSSMSSPSSPSTSLNSTPRASTSGAPFNIPVSSPSSPLVSSSTPANSISRRASINLISPPRPFAPGSPTSSRGPNRSQLSAQMSTPYPAAPPPAESIKLTKVPESVRSAIDFRPTFSQSQGVSGVATSSSALDPFTLSGSLTEVRVPKTPSATRAPSPASGSGSSSPAHSETRSRNVSNPSSRAGSQAPSRRTSIDYGQYSLSPAPVTPSASSSSAFAPLFPFPSLAPPSPAVPSSRSRAKSVAQPSTSVVTNNLSFNSDSIASGSGAERSSTDSGQHDLGVSPLSQGLSPLGTRNAASTSSSPWTSSFPTSISQRQALGDEPKASGSRLAAHRLSIAPTKTDSVNGLFSPESSTDEYAQIILASRAAKMRKWKSSSGSHPGLTRGSSWFGDMISQHKQNASITSSAEAAGLMAEADYAIEGEGDIAQPQGSNAPNKEVEWVDWLDEYDRMKRAKLAAEQGASILAKNETSASEVSSEPNASAENSRAAEEYNPFEATTATLVRGGVTAASETYLSPHAAAEPASLLSVLTPTTSFQPKTTSAPVEMPSAPLVRSTSSISTGIGSSPGGVKRRRNLNKLGFKIESWWSAVRTSFTAGSPLEETPRTPVDSMISPKMMLEPSQSRTSSQFTRPQTPTIVPTLRNAASAQNLGSRASPTEATSPAPTSMFASPFGSVVPTGALAPGARIVSNNRLQPPRMSQRDSSGSDHESDGAGGDGALNDRRRSDSKRRNPQLSLNLGPSFSNITRGLHSRTHSQEAGKTTKSISSPSDSSNSASAGTSQRFFSPNAPTSGGSGFHLGAEDSSTAGRYLPLNPQTPGVSPAFSAMHWDRTPALVPTSTHFPLRGVVASTEPEAPPSSSSHSSGPNAKSTAVKRRDDEHKPTKVGGVDASQANNFSMHTVRQQIRSRLATAKENCDKELRRIIQGITTHVETELHKAASSPLVSAQSGGPYEEGRFGELVVNEDGMYSTSGNPFEMDSENENAIDLDDGDDVANTDSDGNTSRPPSRTSRLRSPLLSASTSTGPRRPSATQTSAMSRSPRRASLAPRKRHLTSVPRSGDLSTSDSAKQSTSGSAHSSRSNSRSRGTMAPPSKRNVSNGSRSPANASTPSVHQSSLAQSAFIVLLQEIITIATEILDTPLSKFTSNPAACSDFIARVQSIGKAWDDNPELACRGWYVQLLLAVAGLSRVIEWWDAERGFWAFADSDDADAEPILFVTKPTNADSPDNRARGDSYSSAIGAGTSNLPATSTSILPEPFLQSAPRWSPLGIDLGEQSADPEEINAEEEVEPGHDEGDTDAASEDAALRHHDDLRQTVDEIRNSTLLMELTLDDQLFQYLSSAWQEIVGLEPEECINLSIADFVFPDDAAVFAEATRQLEADDSHTVEVNFRLRVGSSSQASNDEEIPEDLYEAMEGKGMLMLDGLTGSPSHTMWVVRPAPLSDSTDDPVGDTLARFGLEPKHRRSSSDPVKHQAPSSRLAVEPVLCRICERATPVWFFEKHNETCNETHRLEGDITECNDRLKELAKTVDDVAAAVDDADIDSPAEYRGIPLLQSAAADTPPSYLENLRPPLAAASRPGPLQVRKAQHRILDQIHEIIQTAIAISTPSVSDETGDIPIQEQRLLSPNSENNLAAVMRWQRPIVEEAALVRLVQDAEEQIRFKLNTVNRLRNTILYAEKVRQEWEARANEALASVAEETRSSPFDSPALQPMPSGDVATALDIPGPQMSVHVQPGRLRRQSSLFGLSSPMLMPDDSVGSISSPPSASVLSPRIPSGVPSSRTKASSIKDFKILKPISKGAFGSVYLAKKITTGDYYAIKTLKKSDMVAKNQVTNVKAERMILMTQTESDFVVKLFYTFQSKDYLYLVMEYLNGGDCGALVKNLGELPEDWAKRYIAEVIVGLEYLHASGIVHRDLKPDNLLIDAKGHLKLTDFGLSRIGLLGRQTQMPSIRGRGLEPGRSSIRSVSRDPNLSQTSSPSSTPANALGQSPSPASYFGSMAINDSFSLDTPESERSSNSNSNSQHKLVPSASMASIGPLGASGARRPSNLATQDEPGGIEPQQKFVGTPDYLAPESILGGGTDACVDWWALGVICYEFLYGVPPFHDETPEKVFENILSRRIEWHEDLVDYSPEARDFMERLLCTDPARRLGQAGAVEVKAHPWLEGIDWAHLLQGEVDFVPKTTDPENTDYFDPRGATDQVFADDDVTGDDLKTNVAPTPIRTSSDPMLPGAQPAIATDGRLAVGESGATTSTSDGKSLASSTSASRRLARERSETEPSPHDDFGTFNFRNLTVLKQANDDVIRKMRDEQLLPPAPSPLDSPILHTRPLAMATSSSSSSKNNRSRQASIDFRGPSSPSSPSNSSTSSVPSRQTAPSSPYSLQSSHSRRPSEVPPTATGSTSLAAPFPPPPPSTAVDRLKSRQSSLVNSLTGKVSQHSRRNSMPSRIRRNSAGESGRPALPESWLRHDRRRTSAQTPPASTLSSPSEAHEPLPPMPRLTNDSSNLTTSASASSMMPPPRSPLPPPGRPLQESSSAPAVAAPISSSAVLSPQSNAATSSSRSNNTIDCLVAGRNPIVTKVLETMLVRLGCRCVVVPNGADAIIAAQGVKFDLIFLDLVMPVVDGETAARMIKSTNNPSQYTPTIACCSSPEAVDSEAGTLFSAVLPKPILKADLLSIFSRLGFRLEEKSSRRVINDRRGSDERRGSNDDAQLRRGSASTIDRRDSASSRRDSAGVINPSERHNPIDHLKSVDERRGSQ